MAAAVLLAGAGCAPPDTPPSLTPPELPAAVRSLLRPDTARTEPVAPGVWYRYLWSGEGPWAIHIVEADLARCDLALRTLQAEARERGEGGREPVSSMVMRASWGVLAAVNADFFTPEGAALGAEVVGGRVTSARQRPVVAWRPGSEPWIGRARIRDGQLVTGWATPLRGSGGGATEAVAGFPEILDAGRRVGDLGVAARPGFAASRHPRTGVGFDPVGDRLWLVVVDGRQRPYSVGMTLPEFASLFEALGAREALNLDGGGSSVMVVRRRTVNHPSDEEGERPVVNALALVRDLAACHD